ncbi:hypothetical protein DERF_011625 [Dermatophagoides farinae]|uniref:Uncharacterized protein n=1 Tax=Dermatophagoides farinae TaxID=6954 RepID=A0A922L1T9_DERFA|nr:hypothetical protein DERF_011625 [Dermatophagoides farinae]
MVQFASLFGHHNYRNNNKQQQQQLVLFFEIINPSGLDLFFYFVKCNDDDHLMIESKMKKMVAMSVGLLNPAFCIHLIFPV